jgi:hypothetical protein
VSYVFLGIAHAPRRVVEDQMLPSVRALLATLGNTDKEKDNEKAKKSGYWDDYCLARFLEGICLRYVAFPVRFLSFFPLACLPSLPYT